MKSILISGIYTALFSIQCMANISENVSIMECSTPHKTAKNFHAKIYEVSAEKDGQFINRKYQADVYLDGEWEYGKEVFIEKSSRTFIYESTIINLRDASDVLKIKGHIYIKTDNGPIRFKPEVKIIPGGYDLVSMEFDNEKAYLKELFKSSKDNFRKEIRKKYGYKRDFNKYIFSEMQLFDRVDYNSHGRWITCESPLWKGNKKLHEEWTLHYLDWLGITKEDIENSKPGSMVYTFLEETGLTQLSKTNKEKFIF